MCPFHNESSPQRSTPPQFRCPFEIKGIQENTIMRVRLDGDRADRIRTVEKAFADFHARPESPGLIFELPLQLLKGISSNSDLRFRILPYQIDTIVGELQYLLHPFLPYQLHEFRAMDRTLAFDLFQRSFWKHQCAELVATLAQGYASSGEDIATFLEHGMTKAMLQGLHNPTILLGQPPLPRETFRISPGIAFIRTDPSHEPTDPRNQNCFSLVRTPFYRREFGRWSEGPEIVFSREYDFARLSEEARRKIRLASNTVLRWGGIAIHDLAEDKPEGEGLWVPETQG